jgi:hypothetical protein
MRVAMGCSNSAPQKAWSLSEALHRVGFEKERSY